VGAESERGGIEFEFEFRDAADAGEEREGGVVPVRVRGEWNELDWADPISWAAVMAARPATLLDETLHLSMGRAWSIRIRKMNFLKFFL
jgi:hypothetical protein